MLSEKIGTLLTTLDITSSDVAKLAGCSPSNFSRLHSGSRTPKATSPTMTKLIRGLLLVAEDEEKRIQICRLCGATAACTDDILKDRLLLWLYDGIELPRTPNKKLYAEPDTGKAILAFSKRLNTLMNAVNLTNGDLSRKTGIDTSYVSRLRRGERMPKYHSKYLIGICLTIINEAKTHNKISTLSRLTSLSMSNLNGADGPKFLRDWLYHYASVDDQLAVDHLLSTLITHSSGEECPSAIPLPSLEDIALSIEKHESILPDTTEFDISREDAAINRSGSAGLQYLVIKFLLEAIEQNEKEMLLYSDQPMNWIDKEYALVLGTLMKECIKNNMRIHILHNIDRSIPELFSAIELWMPLYLSGQVDSYYSESSSGMRFSHTIFIRPGKGCVEGFCARGMEEDCIYRFHRSPAAIRHYTKTLESMLVDSKRLISIGTDCEPEKGDISIENVLVNITADRVVVKRTDPPMHSFTFTHPVLCHAFYSYFQKA